MTSFSSREIEDIFDKSSINARRVDDLFTTLDNPGGGNCLFYSLSQLLYGNTKKHSEIRKRVCEFYKSFNERGDYSEGSLEYKLANELIYSDENHKKIMCKTNEWGTSAEITAISIIYNINIITLNLFAHNTSEYVIVPVKSPHATKTVFLKYNTLNAEEEHYEALMPRGESVPKAEPATTNVKTATTNVKTATTNVKTAKRTKKEDDSYIGKMVAKVFDQGEFIGNVVSYKKPYYKVEYEDGDKEEFTKEDLEKILMGGKRKKTRRTRKTKKTKGNYAVSRKRKRKSVKKKKISLKNEFKNCLQYVNRK